MATKNLLSRRLNSAVKVAVEALFERAKARLLGAKSNRIYIQIVKGFGLEDSIEGVYRHALHYNIGNRAEVDQDLVEAKADEVDVLVESAKTDITKKMIQAVKSGEADAVKDVLDEASNRIDLIVTNELRSTQSLAETASISEVAASQGIEDPQVATLGPHDAKTCKFCLAMYHCKSNPRIPRVHKFSELITGKYFKPKEWDGESVYDPPGVHPRCRHLKTIILPGFGYDNSGKLVYMGAGHNEYEAQRARGD